MYDYINDNFRSPDLVLTNSNPNSLPLSDWIAKQYGAEGILFYLPTDSSQRGYGASGHITIFGDDSNNCFWGCHLNPTYFKSVSFWYLIH